MDLRLEHLPADRLGLSAAARHALAHGELGGLPVVRRVTDVPRPAERHDPVARQELARALEASLDPLDPPGRVRTSLGLLAREGTPCVVTGQQPGLLGGPLYTLYKALQCCRLARELGDRWGVPVVPVFWNHGDDHDVAEVNHAWVLNRNLDLQKLGLAGMGSGRVPIGDLVLSEELHRLGPLRAAAHQAFEEFSGVEAALDLLFPREGETLARALTRTLTGLLGEHGLVVVEPNWIRPQLGRALARVVERDPRRALRAAPPIPGDAGIDPAHAALVFRVDGEGRRALRPVLDEAGDDGYRFDGEPGSRTPAELAAEIVQEPDGWSAGALLRPLVQDTVFPTCAYVGGYGELAYHAQLAGARDAVGLPRTPFVPRVSCTLVDGETRGSLARCEARVGDVLAARGAFTPREEQADEPAVLQRLRALRASMVADLRGLRGDLDDLDPTLQATLKRTADQVGVNVDKLLSKIERVHRNQSGKGQRHVRRLNHGLFPRELPQERVWTLLQLLPRYGPEVVDALWEELPAVCTEHVVVHLPDLTGPDDPTEELEG